MGLPGKHLMLKKGLLLTAGNLSGALLRLIRNIVIARLVSVEDFGITSTFAITMGLVEMMSYVGLERLIIQAKDGDDPSFMAGLNAVQVLRGALSSAVLFFLASPIATLFGIEQVAWAYRVIAIIPMIRGFAHLDMYRLQRDMRFWPSIQVDLISLLISTLAAIPLAFAFGDYRVMVCVLLIEQLVSTIVSQLVATRPYRWNWKRAIFRRALDYGWPLLLAGLAAFASFQGDRVIVGSTIGMTELGWYSVAAGLAGTAATLVQGTQVSFFMPLLSRAQDTSSEYSRLFLVTVQVGILSGVLIACGFAIAGRTMLSLLYGDKYQAALPVLVWVAVMQGVRAGSVATSVAAMSKAVTDIPLIANLVRMLALPVAWLLAWEGGGVLAVVVAGIMGEALSFAVSLYLLRQKLPLSLAGLGMPCALGLSTLAVACVSSTIPDLSIPIIYSYLITALLLLAMSFTIYSMPAARQFGISLLRDR